MGSPKERGFRLNDRVTVHSLMAAHGKPVRGRVICINRKTKYDMPIIVLCDVGDSELIESFTPEGKKYLQGSTCHITLGWKSEG